MAHNRAHSTTPILDCIEVAGSANDSRSGIYDSSDKYQEFEAMSDSNDSFDPRDTTLLDSLDGGSTARARFHLSPDKSNSISNKPSRLQVCRKYISRACHTANLTFPSLIGRCFPTCHSSLQPFGLQESKPRWNFILPTIVIECQLFSTSYLTSTSACQRWSFTTLLFAPSCQT